MGLSIVMLACGTPPRGDVSPQPNGSALSSLDGTPPDAAAQAALRAQEEAALFDETAAFLATNPAIGTDIPGRFLVAFRPQAIEVMVAAQQRQVGYASATSVATAMREKVMAAGSGGIVSVPQATFDQVYVVVAKLPEEQVAALRADAAVEAVEPDQVVGIEEIATQGVQQGSNVPWGLDRIDQANLPVNSTYNYQETGQGVRAYVIDTGILATHTDFGGRVEASSGYSAVPDGLGTSDGQGHGTHVSGIIGGTRFGVAKQVSLVPVRVLDARGRGTISNVIAGVNWVVGDRRNRPAVVNMSLGGGRNIAMNAAVTQAVASGVAVVVAAGNNNWDAYSGSPASAAEVITVAASDSQDRRATFSNFGDLVDLFAPGVAIPSAWIGNNNATYTASGTSMASPHVAGVVATLLQSFPTESPNQIAARLLALSLERVIDARGPTSRLLYKGPPVVPPGGGGGGSATRCTITQSVCRAIGSTYQGRPVIGTFVDNFQNSASSATRCLQRAEEYADWCQNIPGTMTVAAFYNNDVQTHARSYAADGCRIEQSTCYSVNNNLSPGGQYTGVFADTFAPATTQQAACMVRAVDYSVFCRNWLTSSTTATFYSDGLLRQSIAYVPPSDLADVYRNEVKKAYCRVLNRSADGSGLAHYANQLRFQGRAMRDIISEMAGSAEVQAILSGRTAAQRVTWLYDTLLARQPSSGDQNFWQPHVTQGVTPQVIQAFVSSPEYSTNFGSWKVPGHGRSGCN